MPRTKEQDAERKRAERAANPDTYRARERARIRSTKTLEQKAAAAAAAQRWRDTHPEKIAADRARISAQKRERYRTDEVYREAAKAAARKVGPAAQRDRRTKLRGMVFDHYGRICACCGETEYLFLTLGHVNGDGAAHRRSLNMGRSGGGATIWLDIIRRGFPADFRIECYNCNCGAFRNGGVCPHVKLNGAPLLMIKPAVAVALPQS